jgi:putative intracellular protease/amidase
MAEQTVYLYVFDTLADWEPSFAIAGINNPAFQEQPGRFEIKTVGETREPVKTIGGVTILPDSTLAELEIEGSALLILPGGNWSEGTHRAALEKARQFLAAGIPVAAICGATEGLARAGMLDSVQHTSNAPAYLQATGYLGGAHYLNQGAVTAGNLITAGAAFPIDFAYQIFQKLGIYSPSTLEAWYGLYTTGDASHFYKMARQ